MEEIYLGIIGGLITAIITIAFQSFWKKVIIPWYEELLFKDVKIEGLWNGFIIDNHFLTDQNMREPDFEKGMEITTNAVSENYRPAEIRVELKRSGYKIVGKVISLSGSDKGNLFYLEGSFKNLILSGLYESNDKEIIDRGSFSVMAIHNGKMLKGYFSSYENHSNSVRPFYCLLKKK